MKRKTRKRLAKEAEIARKEAKTGKFSLPQPTLPKIGLQDEDLYAPSYAGSEVGGSSRAGGGGSRNGGSRKGGNGSQYQYPPPSNSSNYGGGGSEWDRDNKSSNGGGGGGLQYSQSQSRSNAGVGTIGGSNLSRSAYPYAGSDQSLNQPGGGRNYAESTNSLDDLASRGAAMGYDSYPSGLNAMSSGNGKGGRNSFSNEGRIGSNGRSRLSESQAPSYHSEDEKLSYGDEFSNDGRTTGARESYGYNNNSNSFTQQQRSHDPYAQTQHLQQQSQHDQYYSQNDQHQQNQYDQDQFEYDNQHQQYDQHQQHDQYEPQQQSYGQQHQSNSIGMARGNSDGSGNDILGGYSGGWEESEGRNFEPDHYSNNYNNGNTCNGTTGGGGGGGGGSGRAR